MYGPLRCSLAQFVTLEKVEQKINQMLDLKKSTILEALRVKFHHFGLWVCVCVWGNMSPFEKPKYETLYVDTER